MKIMRYGIVLFCAAALSAGAQTDDQVSAREKAWKEEMAIRYDTVGWAGKKGPVVAGVAIEELASGKQSLALDHVRWLTVKDEKTLFRQFAGKDHRLLVEVIVTRTCEAAHQVLFDHLARPRSIAPQPAPSLPYGEIRLEDIGHVCFALPGMARDRYASIEFVRNNVVVLLRSEPSAGIGLLERAREIDRSLLRSPLFADWKSSGRWPSIRRFSAGIKKIEHGASARLEIQVSNPGNAPLITAYEVSAGGVLEEKDGPRYSAGGTGIQTLILMKADTRGLAASARLEIEVLPEDP